MGTEKPDSENGQGAAEPRTEHPLEAGIKFFEDTPFSLGLSIGRDRAAGRWWEQIPGGLLPAIAVYFGFEMLNRIMRFRSTFKPKLPDLTQ